MQNIFSQVHTCNELVASWIFLSNNINMIKHVFLISLCVLLVAPSSDNILALTDSTFQQTLKQHPKLFVDFYAPWCDHCKQLAPQLQKLAQNKNLKAKIAKIDSTENEQSAVKFNIESYPTLLYFTEDFYVEYRSFRTAEAMEAWLEHKDNPFHVVGTQEQLDRINQNGNMKVFYYGNRQGENFETWRKASFHQDQQQFVLVESEQLLGGHSDGTILLSAKFMHQPMTYTGSPNLDELRIWIEENSNPPVRPFTQKAIKLIFQQEHPALLLLNRHLNDTDSAIRALEHFCAFKDHQFICTQVTPEDDIYGNMVKWLEIDKEGSFLVLLDTGNRKLYLYEGDIQGITNDLLMDWVKAYEDGALTPVPRTQDEQRQQQTHTHQQQEGQQIPEYSQTHPDHHEQIDDLL